MSAKFAYEHPAYERAHELFMAIAPDSEAEYKIMPLRCRYLVDIMDFDSITLNGGITSYMDGPSADHVLQCLEALEAIGATKAHALLKSICDLFPEHRPATDQEERGRQLRQLAGPRGHLEVLVEDGIEYELWELFLKYWDAHESAA